jgi:Na+(H+)/acetate symporter ActP
MKKETWKQIIQIIITILTAISSTVLVQSCLPK